MTLNQKFSSESLRKQTSICVVVKPDSDLGPQVAVIKGSAGGQNATVLPSITGNPCHKSYAESRNAILGGFKVKHPKIKILHAEQGEGAPCIAVIGEVGQGLEAPEAPEAPEPYVFVPLTGAYNDISYPEMKQAIIEACTQYNVPLVDRSVARPQRESHIT